MKHIIDTLMKELILAACFCSVFLGCKKSQDGEDRCTQEFTKEKEEMPVVAESTAKTNILSQVKANAREVIVRMNGSHKKEIQQVCDQIDAVDDAVERHALFEELVDEVLAVDLSDLAAQHPEDPLDAMASERQLARAHSALQYVVEQVWQRLMLRSEPPESQLDPWMKLIVKMKSEDERLQTGGRCQEDAIEFVERWFGKYVKACSFQSQEALNAFEQRFSDVVGRPIHK